MALRMMMVATEADLLRRVARRLTRERPDSAFEGFSDPARALARLRELSPDVLVADARMPGMTGLELVAAARVAAPDLAAIVLATDLAPDLLSAVDALGNAELLEAPVVFEVLIAAIDRAAFRRATPKIGFSGRLRLPMLPDLVQTLALARASVSLKVLGRGQAADADAGWVWFLDGEVVHARRGELSGPEAFYSLLALAAGSFRSEAYAEPPERTIAARWEELLMEGLRRVDENARVPVAEPPPPAESPFPADEMRLLRQSVPAGDDDVVVVAFRPSTGKAAFVKGGREPDLQEWRSALVELSRPLPKLSGEPEALFEDIREETAVALSWSGPRDRVVLLCQPLSSAHLVSRFRLRCAAFHRALCSPLEATPATGPASVPRGEP